MLPTIIEPFHSRMQQQGQNLQLNLPQNLLSLVSDRASCERLLVELLNNACEYTRSSGEIILSLSDRIATATIFTISNSLVLSGMQMKQYE